MTRQEMEKLSDSKIAELWLASVDPEHPSEDESLALLILEERNVDF
tara:strand:- start:7204 stop:7341 length:138 start_codon:yes stop_codon:yes gene_type:complete